MIENICLPLVVVVAGWCAPPADVRSALDALDEFDASAEPVPPHTQRVVDRASAIAKQSPDFATYAAYLRYARMYHDPRAESFRAALAKDPSAAAQLLVAGKGKERTAALEKLVAAHPDYAPAWQALGGAAGDDKRAQEVFDKVRALCPEPNAWQLMQAARMQKREALVKGFRAAIDKLATLDAARLLPDLWQLELAVSGAAGADAVKANVRRDLARLETLDSLVGLSARLAGETLLGAPAGALTDTLLAKYPYSEAGNKAAGAMSKALWQLDDKARLSRTAELVAKYPARPDFADDRFQALAAQDQLGPREKAELTARADALLAKWRAEPPQLFDVLPLRVATAFIQHGLELERVSALLDEADKALLAPLPKEAPEQMRAMMDKERLGMQQAVSAARIDLAEAQGDFKTAAALIDSLAKSADKRLANTLTVQRARLLHAGGNFGDALAMLVPIAEKPAAKHALTAIWRDLGGSDQGLKTLLDSRGKKDDVAVERWEKVNKPLPALTLKDTSGKTWTNKDLAGKRVFINIWASWCEPCKQELPHVVALEKLGRDKNLLVLTFNVDEEPGAAAAYLALHPLALPVVLNAQKTIQALTATSPIPRSWLVDASSTLTHEIIGFDPAVENWSERMLAQINALSK